MPRCRCSEILQPPRLHEVHTGPVISCSQVGWWRWYWRGIETISIGGGFIMLAIAAVAHNAASIALLIIGGWWFAVGVLAFIQAQRTAREVQLVNGAVTFIFPKQNLTVPVGDIEEVRRSRGDINRFAPIRFRTASHGVVKAVPRLQGMFDFLVELRRVNPQVVITGLDP